MELRQIDQNIAIVHPANLVQRPEIINFEVINDELDAHLRNMTLSGDSAVVSDLTTSGVMSPINESSSSPMNLRRLQTKRECSHDNQQGQRFSDNVIVGHSQQCREDEELIKVTIPTSNSLEFYQTNNCSCKRNKGRYFKMPTAQQQFYLQQQQRLVEKRPKLIRTSNDLPALPESPNQSEL